jgi:penicillin-binding protein 2
VLGIIILSLFAALFSRLWYLQVMDSSNFQVQASNNQVRIVYEAAPRGRIIDRQGKVLVDNRDSLVLSATRNTVNKHEEVVGRVAALLNLPTAEVKKRVDDVRYTTFAPVPIARDVDPNIVVYVEEHKDQFPGIAATHVAVRTYPQGSVGAHVLGYVGQVTQQELDARKGQGYRQGDTIGKQGVERTFESELRGVPGQKKLEVNAAGKETGQPLGETPPRQGNDVQLSIDLDVQRLAEESLAQGLELDRHAFDKFTKKDFAATAGSVVVMDPKDGAVLALASYPTFNPGDFVNGIRPEQFAPLNDPASHCPLCDRNVTGQYAPGSTFKLITATAALRRGLINNITTYQDNGSIKIGNREFKNPGGEANGRVNVTRAITVSSDVFFYTLGAALWNGRSAYGEAIQDTAKDFGMADKTEIDLPSEFKGRIPDPETRKKLHEAHPQAFPNSKWFTGDNVNLAIGQGEIVVTPLELANAYAAFANGGTLFQPRIADKVLAQDKRVVRPLSPRPLRTIDLPATLRNPILQGLIGVTTDPKGTAKGAFTGFNAFPVAGKTGTAQVFGKQDTALFVSFAPASDPQYVVAVVMEESGFGGAAAAPVARRIYEGIAGQPPAPVSLSGGVD